MQIIQRLVILVVFLMFGASCNDDRGVPETFGEACEALAHGLCKRGDECFYGFPVEVCYSGFMGACCAYDDVCDEPVTVPDPERWHECTDVLDTYACKPLQAGIPPAACIDVLD